MDRASIQKWIITAVMAVTSLAVPVEAEACFFNWFRRRQPTTTYYPTTATAATAAAAPSGASCGAAYCEQTVLRYVPQVAYRTVWQPVPVTTYRRTVSYNPSSGLPMTCTQPCTSYTYQARRVPYTSFRPVYSQVPVTNASAGCNSCQATTAPPVAATPYYQSTPTTTQPAFTPQTGGPATTSDPPGASPWEPVQQSPVSPAPANGYSAPPPTTTDPADDRPRIDPQAGEFSSIQRIPSTVANSSFSIAPSNAETTVARPADPFNRKIPSSAQSSWTSETPNPSAVPAQPTTTDLDIRPIPQVAPQPQEANAPAPPVLNQPRENTALIRTIPTEWASNRIQWSEQQVSHSVPVKADNNWKSNAPRRLDRHRVQEAQQPQQWDTTGWRSASKS